MARLVLALPQYFEQYIELSTRKRSEHILDKLRHEMALDFNELSSPSSSSSSSHSVALFVCCP